MARASVIVETTIASAIAVMANTTAIENVKEGELQDTDIARVFSSTFGSAPFGFISVRRPPTYWDNLALAELC